MSPNNDSPPTPDAPPPVSVLDRYLAGTATADERVRVEQWWRSASTSDRVSRVLGARTFRTPPNARDTEDAWGHIQTVLASPSRSAAAESTEIPFRPPRIAERPFRRSLLRVIRPPYLAAIAATALLLMVSQIIPHGTRSVATTERTYTTRTGQRAVVILTDGSHVTLAPATTLRTSVSTATQAMTVTVDGEALFQVVHRPHVPFTVRTRNAITRVLGTQFLVRQYAADPVAQVVVTDGRVSLQSVRQPNATGAVMTARMMGLVDDSGYVRVSQSVTSDEYTAWTTGQLVFRQVAARQIAADLGRAYGVDLRITDSALAGHVLTWSVSVTQITLADALDALTDALNAHLVRSGDTITLVPGRTTQAWPRHRDSSLSRQEHTYGR